MEEQEQGQPEETVGPDEGTDASDKQHGDDMGGADPASGEGQEPAGDVYEPGQTEDSGDETA